MAEEKEKITVEELELYLKDLRADRDILLGQTAKAKVSLQRIENEIENIETTLKTVREEK